MAFVSEIDTYFAMKKHVKKTQFLLPLEGMICKTVGGKKNKTYKVQFSRLYSEFCKEKKFL